MKLINRDDLIELLRMLTYHSTPYGDGECPGAAWWERLEGRHWALIHILHWVENAEYWECDPASAPIKGKSVYTLPLDAEDEEIERAMEEAERWAQSPEGKAELEEYKKLWGTEDENGSR